MTMLLSVVLLLATSASAMVVPHQSSWQQRGGLLNAEKMERSEFLQKTGAAVALGVSAPAVASVAEPSASSVGAGVAREVARKILQIERLNVDSNNNGDPKKHLPQLSVSGTKVTCSVPHVMDPAKPHFIEYIWLKNDTTEAIIAAKQFAATDPSPPTLVADVRKGTTIVPVAYCNLHGIWIGDADVV